MEVEHKRAEIQDRINHLYDKWISDWRNNVIHKSFFMLLGGVLTIISFGVLEQKGLSLPPFLLNSTTEFPQFISSFSSITLTFNGLIIGISPISVFNFITWSDNIIKGNPSNIDELIVLRSAFSRFSRTYFELNITLLFIQVSCVLVKNLSIFLGGLLLLVDIFVILILLEGFSKLIYIVLIRVEAEDNTFQI